MLSSLSSQSLAKDRYEVIVVDNGSSDDTRTVVEERASIDANVRYVWEPVAGLSRGRNAGVKHASGRIIAFIDDDVVATPNWLEQIVRAFRSAPPQIGCVGGIIEADWGSIRRPRWLTEELVGALPVFDKGGEPHVLEGGLYLYGTNVAVLRTLFEQCGGFPEFLGRKGKCLLGNEDQFLQIRLWSMGHRSFYDPTIVVRHRIDMHRLKKTFILRQCFWLGVSERLVSRTNRGSNILRNRWTLLLSHLRKARPFVMLCSTYWLCGYLVGGRFKTHQAN